MRDGPLWFTVVPHEAGSLAHHLEVGPLSSNFILPSVPWPFLRADEELGISREVVENFKYNIVKFTCFILQVQDDGDYPLGIDESPDAIDFCIVPLL